MIQTSISPLPFFTANYLAADFLENSGVSRSKF